MTTKLIIGVTDKQFLVEEKIWIFHLNWYWERGKEHLPGSLGKWLSIFDPDSNAIGRDTMKLVMMFAAVLYFDWGELWILMEEGLKGEG